MGFFLKLFGPGNGGNKKNKKTSETSPNRDEMTNQVLYTELCNHFNERLLKESFGQKMIFPMSFVIMLDNDDYIARQEFFPYIIEEVVGAYHNIIRSHQQKLPNVTQAAKEWFFQFIPCHTETIDQEDGSTLTIKKGHITTIATLLPPKSTDDGNMMVEANMGLSIKIDNSNVVHDKNVNWDAISRINILGGDSFSVKFDIGSPDQTSAPTPKPILNTNRAKAELTYSKDGLNHHFLMLDDLVHLSGNNDLRKGRAFMKINSDSIRNSHIQIKYLPNEGRFMIAAFGPARLNSKLMAESTGADINWYNLANNSSIFINDEVKVKFEIK